MEAAAAGADSRVPSGFPPTEPPWPAVARYGPSNVVGLQPGEVKLWCRCGLSKSQPWCDGAHKGTNIKPLRWVVPAGQQTRFSICACKHTSAPPFCDGRHVEIALDVRGRIDACTRAPHDPHTKLCEGCGWTVDF